MAAHQSKRTPEIVDAILAEITTSSTANLRDACKRQGIAAPTFMDWVDKDEDLAERYARAKEAQTELMVNEMVSISDDPSLDANSKRVMIDTRKWIASKLKPKKYGDRTAVEHSGGVEIGLKTLLEELDGTSLGPPSLRGKSPREK